jgi:hypothetical protein
VLINPFEFLVTITWLVAYKSYPIDSGVPLEGITALGVSFFIFNRSSNFLSFGDS